MGPWTSASEQAPSRRIEGCKGEGTCKGLKRPKSRGWSMNGVAEGGGTGEWVNSTAGGDAQISAERRVASTCMC